MLRINHCIGSSLFLLLCAFLICGSTPGISETDADQEVRGLTAARIKPLKSATVEQLRAALNEPMPKEHGVSKYLEAPEYKLTMGWIRDFFECEIAGAIDPERKDPLFTREVAVEYARRMQAAGGLHEKDEKGVVDWFWQRKDQTKPTVLDALVFHATARSTRKMKSEEIRKKVEDLFTAKNPVCRMFAVRHLGQWANNDEMAALLEKALTDEYWYTRKSALNYLRGPGVKDRKRILEDYLKKSKTEQVPNKFTDKKKHTEEEVQRILAQEELTSRADK